MAAELSVKLPVALRSVRVALFGGSFNPPHQGHVLAAVHVLSTGMVDRVLVVPVFEHALSKSLLPYEERMGMAQAAFDWIPGVEVSAIEGQLGAPSRTLTTLTALLEKQPTWAMRLMVGSDILGELHRWHAFDDIERLAPPLVLARAGDPNANPGACTLPEVSSTEIRRLLEARRGDRGTSEPTERLTNLVPARVLKWIEERNLYCESNR